MHHADLREFRAKEEALGRSPIAAAADAQVLSHLFTGFPDWPAAWTWVQAQGRDRQLRVRRACQHFNRHTLEPIALPQWLLQRAAATLAAASKRVEEARRFTSDTEPLRRVLDLLSPYRAGAIMARERHRLAETLGLALALASWNELNQPATYPGFAFLVQLLALDLHVHGAPAAMPGAANIDTVTLQHHLLAPVMLHLGTLGTLNAEGVVRLHLVHRIEQSR